jgi:hypothetical protein
MDFYLDEGTVEVIYFTLRFLGFCVVVPTVAALAACIYIARKW